MSIILSGVKTFAYSREEFLACCINLSPRLSRIPPMHTLPLSFIPSLSLSSLSLLASCCTRQQLHASLANRRGPSLRATIDPVQILNRIVFRDRFLKNPSPRKFIAMSATTSNLWIREIRICIEESIKINQIGEWRKLTFYHRNFIYIFLYFQFKFSIKDNWKDLYAHFPNKLGPRILRDFSKSPIRANVSIYPVQQHAPINRIQLVSLISPAIFHPLTHNFANLAERIHPFNPCHRSTQRKY